MTMNTTHRDESGMTLIEIAMVVIIAGVMLGAALNLYNKNRDQIAIGVTKERMHFIASALSRYAETNNRIPCPADPSIVTARVAVVPPVGREPWRFGFERGINQPTASTRPGAGVCTIGPDAVGIVPYQTLNIPYEYMKDGWGNYFTYKVSRVFAQPTDFADTGTAADTTHTVHERCREPGWVINNYPTNAPKARFCCLRSGTFDQNSDLLVSDMDKGPTVVTPARNSFTVEPAFFDAMTVPTRASAGTTPLGKPLTRYRAADPASRSQAAAFVLISHGKNGKCSFLVNDTANRKEAPCAGSEGTNATNWRINHTGVNLSSNFDDIVFWLTQDGLMAYNGTSSCNLP